MSTTKNIFDNLSLPDEIKEKALSIYSQCGIQKRKTKKRHIMLYCIYNAYLDLGRIINIKELTKLLEIDDSTGVNIIRKYSRESNYKTPIVIANPEDIMNEIIRSLKIIKSDKIFDILDHAKDKVKGKFFFIKDLCLACIYVYFESNNENLTEEHCSIVNRKLIDVKKIVKSLKYFEDN